MQISRTLRMHFRSCRPDCRESKRIRYNSCTTESHGSDRQGVEPAVGRPRLLPVSAACRLGSVEPGRLVQSHRSRRLVDCQDPCSLLERDDGGRVDGMLRRLALVQGLFYLATGLWPLVPVST
jgi:hypothetical protein